MRLALVLLLALPASGFAQEEDLGSGCNACQHTGVRACSKHPSNLVEAEQQVLFCSVAAACEVCAGGLAIDCKRCSGGPDNLVMELRQERVQSFLKEPSAAEILLQRPLVRIITPHFDIIVDARKLKDGSHRMSSHEVAHALATEMEKAATLLDIHLDAKIHNYGHRSRIWYWGDKQDHSQVNRQVLGVNDTGAFTLYGPEPAHSSWTGEQGLEDDALQIVSNGVHLGIHMLLSSVFRAQWIGRQKAGWFDDGAAHWYEDALFLRISTYCIDEANSNLNYEDGQWRVAMRRYLVKHKESLLPSLMKKLSGTLWGEEHAMSWSLYDWLVAEHPSTLKAFLMGYKNKQQTRDLLRKNLDMTILQVEDAWRKWVLATYPVKDPKPRKKL